MKFPFVRPEIAPPSQWIRHLDAAYEAKYFSNFGPAEQALTRRLAAAFAGDGTSCVICNNATIGLTAALLALGCRGTVVLPAFTFPATVQAVLAARCTAVLCDVDPDTWELSAPALADILQTVPDVVAVMPVRVFGYVRDLSDILALARRHTVPVVVDAAAALGATRIECGGDNPPVIEVFSLHATKSFGIGEGGVAFMPAACVGNFRKALNFGLNPDRSFDYGLNGKMSEFQAAVGLAVIDEIDGMAERRHDMCALYDRLLADYPTLRPGIARGPAPDTNYPVLMPADAPVEALCERTLELGLQIRRYYFPSLSTVQIDGVSNPFGTPVADDLSLRMICLPVYSRCSQADMDEIADIFRRLMDEFGIK